MSYSQSTIERNPLHFTSLQRTEVSMKGCSTVYIPLCALIALLTGCVSDGPYRIQTNDGRVSYARVKRSDFHLTANYLFWTDEVSGDRRGSWHPEEARLTKLTEEQFTRAV